MKAAELRFGIVGGGPGGLLTAIALKRKGFRNIHVFERDEHAESRTQGYSFSLFRPGGLTLIEELGLSDEIAKFSFQTNGMRFVDALDGSVRLELHESSAVPGRRTPPTRVMRGPFRKLLIDVCEREGIPITWNSRVLKYEEKDETVEVIFENNERREFDILIGADGIQSPLRAQLVGDELNYTGYTCFTGVTKRSEVPEAFDHEHLNKSGMIAMSPARTAFMFHHNNNELLWIFTVKVPLHYFEDRCGHDRKKWKEEVVSRIDDMAPLFKNILQGGEPTGIIPFRDRTPLVLNKKTGRAFTSKTGRITLLGDAAHPMVPFKGAGGNNAMLDARELVNDLATLLDKTSLVTRDDIAQVLRKFESEMIARTTPEVQGSRTAMNMMHSSNPIMIKLRNAGMAFGNFAMNTYPRYKSLRVLVNSIRLTVVAAVLYVAVTKVRSFVFKK